MPNLKRAKVIVLKKNKYGEADLIIHALTSDGDKISFIARGALRSKKRFAGGLLEPTHYLDVQYKMPQQSEQLHILEEASLLDDFNQLRLDYDRLSTALRLLEIVSHVGQAGDQHSGSLFNLLGHALRNLQTVKDINSFSAHFYIKLLSQQGVLESESWMQPFLALPVAHHDQSVRLPIEHSQLNWLESQIRYQLTFLS